MASGCHLGQHRQTVSATAGSATSQHGAELLSYTSPWVFTDPSVLGEDGRPCNELAERVSEWQALGRLLVPKSLLKPLSQAGCDSSLPRPITRVCRLQLQPDVPPTPPVPPWCPGLGVGWACFVPCRLESDVKLFFKFSFIKCNQALIKTVSASVSPELEGERISCGCFKTTPAVVAEQHAFILPQSACGPRPGRRHPRPPEAPEAGLLPSSQSPFLPRLVSGALLLPG